MKRFALKPIAARPAGTPCPSTAAVAVANPSEAEAGQAGAVEAEWGVSESNRRAKFYRLTPAGRRQLAAEVRTFRAYAEAVLRILDATEGV